jgi:hypothetical protein
MDQGSVRILVRMHTRLNSCSLTLLSPSGVPLHPIYRTLVPLLDTFTRELVENFAPLIVSPPHLIPSTRFSNARYPPSLSRHLLSLRLSTRPSTIRQATDQTITTLPNAVETAGKGRPSSQSLSSTPPKQSQTVGSPSGGPGTNFLGIPSVNMNMDVRKWSWPGVLTFGKNYGKKTHELSKDEESSAQKAKENPKEEGNSEDTQAVNVNVDTSSLEDAMASDARSVVAVSVETNSPCETDSTALPSLYSEAVAESEALTEDRMSLSDAGSPPDMSLPFISLKDGASSLGSSVSSYHKGGTSLPSQTSSSTPIPEFLSTMVHLPVEDGALMTQWRKVLYLGVGLF